MSSKLTLSINPSVVEMAKKYANSKGKSLSNIVEEYLRAIATPKEKQMSKLAILEELKGSVKVPEGKEYRELLEDALVTKYLKND